MKKRTKIKGKIDRTKIPRGHTPHRGGAGFHGDRRLKRENTRSKISEHLKDWE